MRALPHCEKRVVNGTLMAGIFGSGSGESSGSGKSGKSGGSDDEESGGVFGGRGCRWCQYVALGESHVKFVFYANKEHPQVVTPRLECREVNSHAFGDLKLLRTLVSRVEATLKVLSSTPSLHMSYVHYPILGTPSF